MYNPGIFPSCMLSYTVTGCPYINKRVITQASRPLTQVALCKTGFALGKFAILLNWL